MSTTAGYDDSNLRALLDTIPVEKQEKATRNAIRNAMRRLATPIRRRVIEEAKTDGIEMDGPLRLKTNSVRVVVYKKSVGFKVTIAPRRKKGGIKPVLPWLVIGTAERSSGIRYTGRLSAHDFGERAYDGALGHTQYRLKEAIIEAAKKQAAKHGAR